MVVGGLQISKSQWQNEKNLPIATDSNLRQSGMMLKKASRTIFCIHRVWLVFENPIATEDESVYLRFQKDALCQAHRIRVGSDVC